MGRGNVCVTGPYEGLYYIDNDDYYVYRKEAMEGDDWAEFTYKRYLDYGELTSGDWELDELSTEFELEDILDCFVESVKKMFPSFGKPKRPKWRGDRKVLLENRLFEICMEDNQWSVAIELIQKENEWTDPWTFSLQKRHYRRYLDGMKKALLERLPIIGTYAGAWTSGWITREVDYDGNQENR